MITNAGSDEKIHSGLKVFLMAPEKSARLAIRSLKKGRIVAVPELSIRVGLFLTRFLPRRALIAIAGRLFKL
jgi:short-subunit dehydrogenase